MGRRVEGCRDTTPAVNAQTGRECLEVQAEKSLPLERSSMSGADARDMALASWALKFWVHMRRGSMSIRQV